MAKGGLLVCRPRRTATGVGSRRGAYNVTMARPVDKTEITSILIPEALPIFEKVTRKPPLPEILYHYTNGGGLLGILSSESIWATNARYLNDTSELNYGRILVSRVVSQRVDLLTGHTQKWLAEFVDLVHHAFDTTETYVACFCERADLLSQWRAYGSGRGFALGFSAARLSRLVPNGLFRVEYDQAEQEKAVGETIAVHIARFEATVAAGKLDQLPWISGALAVALALWVVVFKHPSFAEENEWRMCPIVPVSRVRVRSDGGWLRPYMEISLSHGESNDAMMPLRSITHGPAPHPDLEKRSLRLLLQDTKYTDVSLFGSEVPLRV